MSFLSACSPCFRSCWKRFVYEKVEPKTKTRPESTYELIETPLGSPCKNDEDTRQPLLGEPATAHKDIESQLKLATALISPQSEPGLKRTPLALKEWQRVMPTHPSPHQSGPKVKPYFEVDQKLSDLESSLPLLQFSILYDFQCRSVTVNIQEATNLPTEPKSKCNPHVGLYFLPNNDRILGTRVLFNNANPRWNESFEFPNQTLEVVQKQTLVFRVYNKQKSSRNIFIGMVMLPLAEVDLYGIPIRMIIKKEGGDFSIDQTGGLHLSLEYFPDRGLLGGVVIEAHNLRKQGHFHTDPYVKVLLLYRGERMLKWKTSVKKNTLLPVFNEAFNFNIFGLDIREITLQAMVMDHGKLGRNEHIGTVWIGEKQPMSGKVHWGHMLASPNQSVDHWHMIIPPGLPQEVELSVGEEKHV